MPGGGFGWDEREPERALRDALAFIRAAAEDGPIPSLLTFDPFFESSFPPSEARKRISLATGTDIGYDLGDDQWVAICGLPLLPASEEALIRDFARRAGQGRSGPRFRFFLDRNGFPADVDCTAVAGHALYERGLIPAGDLVATAQELLLAAVPAGDADRSGAGRDGETLLHPGVPTVYWHDGAEPDALPRSRCHDPVVCANALCVLMEARTLGLRNADDVIDATQRYVAAHLLSDSYLQGSRYYPAPEAFLFAASRLVKDFPECGPWLREPLAQAITAREAPAPARGRDDPRTALNVALRVIAAHNIGLRDGREARLRALLDQQARDGSWAALPYFTLGRLPVYFGSPVLTTLFAAAAVHVSTERGACVDPS